MRRYLDLFASASLSVHANNIRPRGAHDNVILIHLIALADDKIFHYFIFLLHSLSFAFVLLPWLELRVQVCTSAPVSVRAKTTHESKRRKEKRKNFPHF